MPHPPLVINSLRGGHTHKHAHTYTDVHTEETRFASAYGQLTPGLKRWANDK